MTATTAEVGRNGAFAAADAPVLLTPRDGASDAMDDKVGGTTAKSRKVVGPVWVDMKQFRLALGENQVEFWRRFGVTQSAGSRYELNSRGMPRSVRMIVIAFATGLVSEETLGRLVKVTERAEEDDDRSAS